MVDLVQPAFSGGELTPLAYGRTDLTKYGTGLRKCKNWIIRPHGCVMNRAGSPYVAATKFSGASKSRLVPFVFSDTQSYILEFSNLAMRVYQNGVYTGVEAVTPYLTSDLPMLQYAQSADVLTLTLKRLPQYEVRRTSLAPTFTVTLVTYNKGPFLTQNTTPGIQVAASDITGTVTITANSPIFNANHVGALFRIEQEDVSTVKPWEPTKILKTAAASPVGEIRRNDGKTYKCVAPVPGGGTVNTATGSIPPTHDSGTEMDGDGNKIASFADIVGVSWLYLDSGFGIVRITGFTSATQVTGTVVQQLPSTVVGSAAVVAGPWNFVGNNVTLIFGPLTGNTSAVSTDYVVTLDGIVADPTQYTVTQPNGNITFASEPSLGAAIVVNQVGGAGGSARTSLWSFGAWSPDQGYPTTVTYFQDRIFFAGTTGQPQGVWASRTGQYYDFGTSVPAQDDDSLAFFLNARQINSINDLIALESLLAATSTAIWRVTDGQDEVLTPSSLGFKPQNFIGSASNVRSAIIGDSAAYVQKNGRRVRDLLFAFEYDKFTGNELSILAEHLFPFGTTITGLDYAQDPFSLLYHVRSDGVLPTLSYLRDQQVLGWSTFETSGVYEDCCSIPEGTITATYVIVNRIINGVSVRFIERFANREFSDINDAIFLDACSTYDGRNTTGIVMKVTGGSTYTHDEVLLLECGSPLFTPGDVGNEVQVYMTNADGIVDTARLQLTVFNSTTEMTCLTVATVPTSLQSVNTTQWTFKRKSHPTLAPQLVGASVRILADGLDVDPQVVGLGGSVMLAHPAGVVHVGLGYDSDLETLDLNIPGGESIRQSTKTIPRVSLLMHQTRGLSVGPDEGHLDEIPPREYEDYNNPPDLDDGIRDIHIPTTPDQSGRVFIRQSAPLPATVIGLIPEVEIGS